MEKPTPVKPKKPYIPSKTAFKQARKLPGMPKFEESPAAKVAKKLGQKFRDNFQIEGQ